MKIVIASSEVSPFAGTGELGVVVAGLARTLAALGHDVRLVLPKYARVDRAGIPSETVLRRLPVPIGGREEDLAIHRAELAGGLPVYLLGNDRYYGREELYRTAQGDYQDNAERFIYFSRSILEMLRALEIAPDILHCNDWQTGLVPAYLRLVYGGEPCFRRTASVFTVHNIAYQGLFWHYDMHLIGLSWDIFTPEGIEFYGKINLLKAGLVYADLLTTGSRRYAQEIQTEECGCGLEGVLRARAVDLVGIPNGIDEVQWDPTADPHLIAPYDHKTPEGKRRCREDLLDRLGFPRDPETPLAGFLAPLDRAHGADLLAEACGDLVRDGVRLVVVGDGEAEVGSALAGAAASQPGWIAVRPATAAWVRQGLAGCDLLLAPARTDPGGTGHLVGLRYGTIPVARTTGILADTVMPFDPRTGQGSGFAFTSGTAGGLVRAVRRALQVYRDPVTWAQLVRNAMTQDVGWTSAARDYSAHYAKILSRRAGSEAGRR